MKNLLINLLLLMLLQCAGPKDILTDSLDLESTIVINEINYHSSDDFNTEDWIELYNITDDTLDLSNWLFKDKNEDNIFIIPESTLIGPDSYIILCEEIDSFMVFYLEIDKLIGNLGFGFNGNGELLRLFNSENELMDYVEYDDQIPWPTEPDGGGKTLELINPDLDNNIPENWTASETIGSPGSNNN